MSLSRHDPGLRDWPSENGLTALGRRYVVGLAAELPVVEDV